jgi:hypothetical protein
MESATAANPDSIIGLPLFRFWDASLAPAGSLTTRRALTSSTACLVTVLRSHGTVEITAIGRCCMYGSVLALGHSALVPLVAGPIKKITDAGKGGRSMAKSKRG